MMTSKAQVTRQLQDLGIEEGDVLLLHTSFRSVRPVEGGPIGFIEAVSDALGPEGTLVMPSWSNSEDLFDPGRSEVAADLGIVPPLFWRLPGVIRSDHVHAFAARGPQASHILGDPVPLPPHIPASPVGRVHELDGKVLLVGVNHDANTTIHLAEILGDAPYRVTKECLVLRDGVPTRLEYGENDHCCARFDLADGWLDAAGLQRRGKLGNATARLVRSRTVVDTVVERLRRDPLIFLHDPDTACDECDEARASVSGSASADPR